MTALTTFIHLPPHVPSSVTVRELLRLIFEEYRWFKPVRYGFAAMDRLLSPGGIDFDALVAFYEERQVLSVEARTDRDFILLYPARSKERPFIGKLIWTTSVKEAGSARWREAHVQQVTALMRLFGSPLAQAGLDADLTRKTQRIVPSPDGCGSELAFTVHDYSEGLAGLCWQNVFGAPFVRLFGGRLAEVPPEQRRELEGGLVLVEPYALPTQAMTPEGDAAEQRLIAQLGPECFYDFARHLKPTHVPDLSGLVSAS